MELCSKEKIVCFVLQAAKANTRRMKDINILAVSIKIGSDYVYKITNNYFRDLACRQNQPITQAEIHNYLNAKRYYKDDIINCIEQFRNVGRNVKQMIPIQHDLTGKPTEKQRSKKLTKLEEELENLRIELENKIEELENIKNLDFKNISNGNDLEKHFEKKFTERFFIYQRKLVLVNNEKDLLILKYKSDLFNDMIFEFEKLYEWLDFRATCLRFNDNDGNEYTINKREVKNVINFFDKLNKIKNDN